MQLVEQIDSNGHITIPNSVTKIDAYAFEECPELTSIEIPDNVTEIGHSAFIGCTGLTSIEMPNSITYIGGRAFCGCTSLSNINIPDSVRKIGFRTFSECTNLSKIEIPNSVKVIGWSAFKGCTSLRSIIVPNSVIEIGPEAFRGCSKLTSIKIPESVTNFFVDTFLGCTSLQTIVVDGHNEVYSSKDNCLLSKDGNTLFLGCKSSVIPESVTKIFEGAFRGCTSLTSIEIPDSVVEIGPEAFSGCSSLTSIKISGSLTKIGLKAFSGCTALKEIVVAEDNEEYSSKNNCCLSKDGTSLIFGCKESIIPESVITIEDEAFKGFSSLFSIDIPDSVTKIGTGAFRGCTGLTSIEIPDSVVEIGPEAFSGCSDLTSIEIPDSILEISPCLFSDCISLNSATLPNSVTRIDEGAFCGCSSLDKIYIPESVRDIKSVIDAREGAFNGCSGLMSIVVSEFNTKYCSKSNCCLSKDGYYLYFGCETSIIPDGVKGIASKAFKGITGLTHIEIPKSVKDINNEAFGDCKGLVSIIINDSLVNISERAFSGCENIKDIFVNMKLSTEIESVLNKILQHTPSNQVVLHVPIGTGYSYRHHSHFCKSLKQVVADSIEKNDESYYVFFDTATAGMPSDYEAPSWNVNNWPRLVHLSWIVQDKDGNTLSKEGHIVRPDGFNIPITASNLHGITTEMAYRKGELLSDVLIKFIRATVKAKVLVCHNAAFCKGVVGSECNRVFGEDRIQNLVYRDIMMESIQFCGIIQSKHPGYKWPKLQEIHNKLFGCQYAGGHNSESDTEATEKCFWGLVNRGIINK